MQRKPVSCLGTLRNVVVILLLSLAVLPACSTHAPRQPEEQHETADRPARSESAARDNLEAAGQATLVVIILGIAAGVAALPVLLVFLL